MPTEKHYDESCVSELLETARENHTKSNDSNLSKSNNSYLDTALEAAEEFNKEFDGLFDA